MKMFPDFAERDSCTNLSITNFYKEYRVVTRWQVMVANGERPKQIEQHTSICSSPYDISALTILEKRYVAVDIALFWKFDKNDRNLYLVIKPLCNYFVMIIY